MAKDEELAGLFKFFILISIPSKFLDFTKIFSTSAACPFLFDHMGSSFSRPFTSSKENYRY